MAASRNSLHWTERSLEGVDAGDVVENAVGRTGIRGTVERTGGSLPLVWADRAHLTQIVTNLVANAGRCGGEGAIICVLSLVADEIEIGGA